MRHRPASASAVRALAVILALVVTVDVGAAQAPEATGPERGAGAEPAFPTVADPRISPSLVDVPVDGPELRAALARYRATEARQGAAGELAGRSDVELDALAEAEQRLVRRLAEARRRADKSTRRLDALRSSLRGLVVADYVRGGTGSVNDPTVDMADLEANDRRRALVEAAYGEQLADVRAHRAALALADATIATTVAELTEVRDRIVTTTATRDRARADEASAAAQLVVDGQVVADARLTSWVIGTDLPFVALDAYVKAATTLAALDPACAVGWPLLAGIGRTESRHGSYGGAVLGPDGSTAPHILGIPLDGTRSARITDTDGGALDGDVVHDRAVGPMQFIPGTWARWGRDGNGDLVADPHNLYDASMAAATYLCVTSTALGDEAGARRGLLAYNRSVEYGTTVLERAAAYAAAVEVPSVPVPAAGGAAPPG